MPAGAMALVPRVVLSFGQSHVEVDASLAERRGGLRLCAREAESKFGLQPNTFGFYNGAGKVDSPAALQKAMKAAGDGVCTIAVREQPEGKLMREIGEAMQAMEARVMAKVDAALFGAQQNIDRVDEHMRKTVLPIVRNISMEQVDIQSKLTRLNLAALDARIDGLAADVAASKEALAEEVAKLSAVEVRAPIVHKDSEALERELEDAIEAHQANDLYPQCMEGDGSADDFEAQVRGLDLECSKASAKHTIVRDIPSSHAAAGVAREAKPAEGAVNFGSKKAAKWLQQSGSLAALPYSGKAIAVAGPRRSVGGVADDWACPDFASGASSALFARSRSGAVVSVAPAPPRHPLLAGGPGGVARSLPLLPPLRAV